MHKAPEELFNFHNKRVIMLHGPNGTGKSTMARVLAN
jgi:polynucleotide 5'-kinase involved in rRNA processing